MKAMQAMFDVDQTIRDFEATIAYLREHEWIQGRNFNRFGGCCAWGAVLMATDDLGRPMSNQDRSPNVARAFYRANGIELTVYNDTPNRTKTEVVTKLTETLAALKAKPSILTADKRDNHEPF